MQKNYTTDRLLLTELTFDDIEFVMKLVNTDEWIKFIGQRNIKTVEDAKVYIQKLIDNPNINYWVVKLQDQTPIGVITFIKRVYLDHHDIGFAFLPRYAKKGYAYEAALAVLNDVMKDITHSTVVATTVPENVNSIMLLEKLGFAFSKEFENEGEKLFLYSIKAE